MRFLKKLTHNVTLFFRKYPRLLLVFPFIVLTFFIYFFIFYKLPSPKDLKDFKVIPLSTHILDRNGKLLYEIYGDQNRTPVKLTSLPKYVAQSSISIEDKDFYKHKGVSIFSGILRAIKDMIRTQNLQGGSTITQQLVKSALLTPERTIQRKVKEIILALWTEQLYNKDQILEMYLNQVPYGGSAYGIQEAAKTFFGKNAKDLDLAEAATLAGLPQAPSLYSPFINPDLTVKRRNEVIQQLFEQKYITKQERDKALKETLKITPLRTNIKAPHFVFYVKDQLEKKYGIRKVEQGGLRVTTTLDLDIQQQAEKILKEELDKVQYLNVGNGAVLVERPPTGEVLAMVGSVDYFASPSGAFNVITGLRQPGSSIKPINYAIGIDRKLVTPATIFLDVPTCFEAAGAPKYCPRNYDGKFRGPVPLRLALGNSLNIPAVKMLAMNGLNNFIASTSAFTITTFKDPSQYGLSLTLGGGEVHPYEMAQAFSTFANRGIPKQINSILKVEDTTGKKLYEFKDSNFIQDIKKPLKYPNFLAILGKRAISSETAFLISHILLDNNARIMEFGPSSELVIPNRAVSVKTGTTDSFKDNWTIGYTPNFLTLVWVGNNDGTPMNQYLASGITGAAPIWNRVMKYVLRDQPDLWPIKPSTVVGKQVCQNTGVPMTKNPDGTESCPSRFEYFIQNTETAQIKTEKKTVKVTKDSDKLAGPDTPNTEDKEKTIISDPYSSYCLDCAGDQFQYPTPTP